MEYGLPLQMKCGQMGEEKEKEKKKEHRGRKEEEEKYEDGEEEKEEEKGGELRRGARGESFGSQCVGYLRQLHN